MVVQIKICGLRTIEDIQMINELDVQYIGFVFAPSRRQITPEQAQKMRKEVRRDIQTVGVFVNTPAVEVNRIAEISRLDIAQLHGEESPEACTKVHIPVWKAIAVKDTQSFSSMDQYRSAQGFVLDTYSKEAKGGTGKTFSWEWAAGLSEKHWIILGGGLHAQNVQQALQRVAPQIVDVSSGVESEGRKDREKVCQFVRKVREYEAR